MARMFSEADYYADDGTYLGYTVKGLSGVYDYYDAAGSYCGSYARSARELFPLKREQADPGLCAERPEAGEPHAVLFVWWQWAVILSCLALLYRG